MPKLKMSPLQAANKEISDMIFDGQHRKGVGCQDLAEKIGVSMNTIYKMRKSPLDYSIYEIRKMCDVTGVNFMEAMTEAEKCLRYSG